MLLAATIFQRQQRARMLAAYALQKRGALGHDGAYWQPLVSRDAWLVLFADETESRNASRLNYEKGAGTFVCAACYLPLFDSQSKYESGTGWPSFWAVKAGAVLEHKEGSQVWDRIEYHCQRCGGHQGHVFNDGPPPTGLRYCNNGVALRFIAQGQALPALRS